MLRSDASDFSRLPLSTLLSMAILIRALMMRVVERVQLPAYEGASVGGRHTRVSG